MRIPNEAWMFPLVMVLAALAMSGCDEVVPAAEGPKISPPTARISKGQSLTFTASDGFEYSWSIANQTWGILSSIEGPSTTYTSLRDSGPEVQTLTLSSRIIGAQGTNGGLNSTEAYITHVSVTITPSAVTVQPGQWVTFRAEDGTDYKWSLRFEEWGSLSTRTGAETIYHAQYDPGTNSSASQVLTVRSYESEANATITHDWP